MTNSVLFMSTVGWTGLNAKKWLQNIQHKFFLGSEETNSPLFHICEKEVSFLSLPIFSEGAVGWNRTAPMGVLCTP